ncbi:MAG: tetratricopeptide repeat protein [Chloroflexi bacterium]|nr:tetratricopeptide repeat protein [Chloroflexota bacterium]
MPGNREAYEQSMNAGHNAAWDQEWHLAVAAYGRAIREFPDDPEAHIHLGLGLYEIGRLEDALKVYSRAYQLSQKKDPIPLGKSADVLEKMGRLREAAQQYANVAELYLLQRDLDKAIHNWERATHLTPGLIPIHIKLAQAYERIGDKKKAIFEYLTLAYNFKRLNDIDKATKVAQRALRLDKENAQIMNTLRLLETGGDILPPVGDGGKRVELDDDESLRRIEDIEDDPLGPLGEAVNYALGSLAIFIMESSDGMKIAADALQAMEAQRQHMNDTAISAYQRADTRLRHPAIKMNLGALLLAQGRPGDAIKALSDAVVHPQTSSGAYHALGKAYLALKKPKNGVRSLIQCIQAVDPTPTPTMETPEMTIFERLIDVVDDTNDENLGIVGTRLAATIEGSKWREKLTDLHRQLEETLREQGMKGVIDFLIATDSDQLARSIAAIDKYLRSSMLTLAIDEAHRAVEISPLYLPVHVRMAEIMMREGRLRNAIAKYNAVARSYMARGENERATEILQNVLEIAPLDVAVRESLIELLEEEERWDEALDHYIDLADVHHQLGNYDLSRDTYALAERIASRVNSSVEKMVRIKHRIADIDQMRLDMRKAVKAYEEIIQLAPDDERAHRALVDLTYRQGNQVEALRRLDKLLGIYARSRQVAKITQLLEELVTLYPTDPGLRSRLSAIYRQLGRKMDAIVHLDVLGELQLQAGAHKQAADTIRQIIALSPENIEDYRQLLTQLGG